MTSKFAYVLLRSSLYEVENIIMISSSCDEITTHFMREFRKLENGSMLGIVRYEFGKLYSNQVHGKLIRHIKRDYDGKITDLIKECEIK